jgi:beta-lactamase superfamily II metal-dependent hydrolase
MITKRFLLFPFLLIFISCEGQKQDSFGTYEAESGEYRNMILLPDQEASGGKYLSIQQNSEVIWDIPLEHSGYYQIVIRYRTRGGDQMQYLVKNGKEIGIGFDMSDDWNLCSQPFYLDSGVNTLGLRDGWGSMDLDWISLERAITDFSITPKKNIYYLTQGRDLVFKIDNFNQQVKQCMLNGGEVEFYQQSYPYQEYSSWLTIPSGAFTGLKTGECDLEVNLESEKMNAIIDIRKEPDEAGLIIVAPDVGHGSAMLLRLPGGTNMLIDCGTSGARDSILVPMLKRIGVDTIQTFILTHYHQDHDGGDSGKVILEDFHVQTFIDYRTYPTGYQWEQDGVSFKVLNSYDDGEEENTRSLSLMIRYNGFRLVHGGDTYGVNQRMILKRFPEDVPADVFYANHHFHGSVYPEYILSTDPDLVILQAQEAIYARAAYMVKYKKECEQVLNRRRHDPVETLPALEVGTIVLRINGGKDWSYETYRDQNDAIIKMPQPIVR